MPAEVANVNSLISDLGDIRRRIEVLDIPTLAYAAIGLDRESFFLSVIDGKDSIVIHRRYKTDDPIKEIVSAVGKTASDNNIKIISAAIVSRREERELGSHLWLEEDIVPHFETSTTIDENRVRQAALDSCTRFDEHGLAEVTFTSRQEVNVAKLTTLHAYQDITPPELWSALKSALARHSKHKTPLTFISATPQGGGVALMRHALIRFLHELGVQAHWHVLQPNSDVFEVTKGKFHNVLQDVAPPDTVLSPHDQDLYLSWTQENADLLSQVLKDNPFIVIDDPQPAGLISHIRSQNPKAKIAYRSHIHLDRDRLAQAGSPQHTTWQFLWQFIKQSDLFVAHPVSAFIPRAAEDMTVTMPATTDLLDGLNKPLAATQMAYYYKLFNKILLEHAQEPLHGERPYIIQIARFDPSKGIADVVEAYRLLREKLPDGDPTPQLVIVGHASIDDPDGVPFYNMTLRLLIESQYRHLASDVKVVRLHHNDQILNALLLGSHVALQLSHKEGFEVKVSEALHKGNPVVAYRAGGIPLQIQHGKNGFLLDIGDTQAVAAHLHELFTNQTTYEEMSSYAKTKSNHQHFTVANAFRWLTIQDHLMNNQPINELQQALNYDLRLE